MRCMSCPYCERYIFTADPSICDIDEIELVECPFGDKAFHLSSKRCVKLKERKELERSLEDAEEIS